MEEGNAGGAIMVITPRYLRQKRDEFLYTISSELKLRQKSFPAKTFFFKSPTSRMKGKTHKSGNTTLPNLILPLPHLPT
jgi:hypothetical protein